VAADGLSGQVAEDEWGATCHAIMNLAVAEDIGCGVSRGSDRTG